MIFVLRRLQQLIVEFGRLDLAASVGHARQSVTFDARKQFQAALELDLDSRFARAAAGVRPDWQNAPSRFKK
jgi:hypothetical protein